MAGEYVRYVMRSGAVIEVTALVEFNGFRFDGKKPEHEITEAGGRPNVHNLVTASGERYHIDQDEVVAIVFGPKSVPPALANKPALGFRTPG